MKFSSTRTRPIFGLSRRHYICSRRLCPGPSQLYTALWTHTSTHFISWAAVRRTVRDSQGAVMVTIWTYTQLTSSLNPYRVTVRHKVSVVLLSLSSHAEIVLWIGHNHHLKILTYLHFIIIFPPHSTVYNLSSETTTLDKMITNDVSDYTTFLVGIAHIIRNHPVSGKNQTITVSRMDRTAKVSQIQRVVTKVYREYVRVQFLMRYGSKIKINWVSSIQHLKLFLLGP